MATRKYRTEKALARKFMEPTLTYLGAQVIAGTSDTDRLKLYKAGLIQEPIDGVEDQPTPFGSDIVNKAY